jgi:hypothetical protein
MPKPKPRPKAPVIPRPAPIAWGCAYPDHSHPTEAEAKACIKRASFVGFCPKCGAPCKWHERNMYGTGIDTCINGHEYPQRDAVVAGKGKGE